MVGLGRYLDPQGLQGFYLYKISQRYVEFLSGGLGLFVGLLAMIVIATAATAPYVRLCARAPDSNSGSAQGNIFNYQLPDTSPKPEKQAGQTSQDDSAVTS